MTEEVYSEVEEQEVQTTQENEEEQVSEESNEADADYLKQIKTLTKQKKHWRTKFNNLKEETSTKEPTKDKPMQENGRLELMWDLRDEYPELSRESIRKVTDYMQSNGINSMDDLKENDFIMPYINNSIRLSKEQKSNIANSGRKGNPTTRFKDLSESEVMDLSPEDYQKYKKHHGF